MDDVAAIRAARRDGLGIRQIARKLAVGRDTVRKALKKPEPRPHTRIDPSEGSALNECRGAREQPRRCNRG